MTFVSSPVFWTLSMIKAVSTANPAFGDSLCAPPHTAQRLAQREIILFDIIGSHRAATGYYFHPFIKHLLD